MAYPSQSLSPTPIRSGRSGNDGNGIDSPKIESETRCTIVRHLTVDPQAKHDCNSRPILSLVVSFCVPQILQMKDKEALMVPADYGFLTN